MPNQIPSLFMCFPGGRRKALTFSYDDGMYLDRRLIDILDAHGMKGTFNVNAGRFADENGFNETNPLQRMTKAQFCETFTESQHEVAIHGYSHCFLDSLSSAGVAHEVVHDREILEGLLGRVIRGMAYPYGAYNDAVISTLRECGVVYSRIVNSSLSFDLPENWLRFAPTCHHSNPCLMELAKQFAEMKIYHHPKMFCVWGHTFEFGQQNNWHTIEEFTDYMAGREDTIWYATNMEIYEYIRDYNRLEFSSDYTFVYNPTCRPLWFILSSGVVYSVNPGETVKL